LSPCWLRGADVIRFHMGPAFGVIAQILVALSLAGIGIAQARQQPALMQSWML